MEEIEEKKRRGIFLLRIVFYFTLIFSFAEIFAGFFSHSLLLVEESVHMFADSVSFGLNLWAEKRSLSGSSDDPLEAPFAQLMGTLVSFLTLAVTLIVVFLESIRRLTMEEEVVAVDAETMLGFGVTLSAFHLTCLVAYFCGVNIPHSHSHSHGHSHGHKEDVHTVEHGHSHRHSHGASTSGSETLEEATCEGHDHPETNANISSAIFHVFVDFLHSFLVIVTAVIVFFYGPEKSSKIDAVASLLLCAVIFSGCLAILKTLITLGKDYREQRAHFISQNRAKHIPLEAFDINDGLSDDEISYHSQETATQPMVIS